MPTIEISHGAYVYLTAYDEDPSWVLDEELRGTFENSRIMWEIRDALGLGLAAMRDNGPTLSAARIGVQVPSRVLLRR
jgi:hypothetical protein